LLAQLLLEAVLLAVASATIGLGVAASVLPWVGRLLPPDLPRLADIRLDARVVFFTVSLSAVTALAAGIVPAWQAGSTPLHSAASERGSAPASHRHARRIFAASQLALTQVLLVTAALLIATLVNLLHTNVGFRPDHVMTGLYYLPDARYVSRDSLVAFHRALADRIGRLPGVVSAGLLTPPPFGFGGSISDIAVDGRTGAVKVQSFLASPDAFAALGIPILAGRVFDEHDSPERARVAVVDERFAGAVLGRGHALGARIRIDRATQWSTIVGVVGHIATRSLDAPTQPQIYSPLFGAALHFTSIVVRTSGDPNSIRGPLSKAIAALDPDLPLFNAAPMEALIEQSAGRARIAALVVSAFASTAWLLAAIGLAGLISGSVGTRRKELGIRLALGARPDRLVADVVAEGLGLTVIAIVAGGVAGVIATPALSALLVGIRPLNASVAAAAAVVLLATGALASYIPARRVSRIDPASSLNISR
jgi:predicted permease